MDSCSQQLLNFFQNRTLSNSDIKIFHISNNDICTKSIEPNHKNTTKMIYNFLVHIYQRNIIASLTKYILLKPLLDKFNSSLLITKDKGIFYLMKQRLVEIIFESVLTAFNGSCYDNFLLCNS